MIKSFRVIALAFVVLLVSCQSGAPQEAIDIAMSELKTQKCDEYGQCRDYKVKRTGIGTLTDASKANGIESSWCIWIDFLFSFSDSPQSWKDNTAIIRILKVNGKLEMRGMDVLPSTYNPEGGWDNCLKAPTQ